MESQSCHPDVWNSQWGKLIVQIADELSREEITKIVEAGAMNDQVHGSFELPQVLAALRKRDDLEFAQIADPDAAIRSGQGRKFLTTVPMSRCLP
jgi:isochorismate synthase EntC